MGHQIMIDYGVAGLHWGIKASFVDYVNRMPDGRATVGAGAIPSEGNVVVFEPVTPASSWDAEDVDRVLRFRGEVRFVGHAGLLFVRLADPWITVRGEQAEMTVLDPSDPEGTSRRPLVRFSLRARPTTDDVSIWFSSDVRLASEATELWNDTYQAGEPFEPLAIFWPAASVDL